MVLLKVVHPLNIYQNIKFTALRLLVQVFHPPKMSERPQFCNGCRYGIKSCAVEFTFNDMFYLLNFIKIYQLVRKLVGGTNTHRMVISLTYTFPLWRKVS
jgi:hypothetical protein